MLLSIARYRILIPLVILFIASYTYACSLYFAPSVSQVHVPSAITLVQVIKSPAVKLIDLTDYKAYPAPTQDGSYEAYKALFEEVANATGVDAKLLAHVASLESGFRKKARPRVGSAKGLFQFTDDHWEFSVKRYGQDFGITLETSPYNARANTILAALSIRDNIKLLETVIVGRKVTPTDVYLAHFLGRTGVIRFMKAKPRHVAAIHMPSQAKRNQAIFYEGSKARTYKEIQLAINQRFTDKAKEFGIS